MTGLCEAWLKPNVFLLLNEASPHDYTNPHVAIATKQGEGVALMCKSIFNSNSNLLIKEELQT